MTAECEQSSIDFNSSNMSSRIYNLFFLFYLNFCVFSLRFCGNKFIVSKFHVIKTVLLLAITVMWFLAMHKHSIESKSGLPDFKDTEFSKRFYSCIAITPFFQILSFLVIQLQVNRHIGKLFNIFLKVKKQFFAEKIEIKNLKQRLIIYFSIFILFIFVNLIIQINGLIKEEISFKTWPFVLGTIITFLFVAMLSFNNAILIIFEFMIRSYTLILDRELKNINHNHIKIELILINLNVIFKSIRIFNKSVSKMLSLSIFVTFLMVVFLVSIFFKS